MLRVDCSLLCVDRCFLFRCVLLVARCLMLFVCLFVCLSFAVRCLLVAVCCVLLF